MIFQKKSSIRSVRNKMSAYYFDKNETGYNENYLLFFLKLNWDLMSNTKILRLSLVDVSIC